MQTVDRILVIMVLYFSAVTSAICAPQPSGQGFLPTWRLLNLGQKEQFVAGYLQGFSDASKLTDVAIGFVDENPSKAKDTLLQLKKIYDSSGLSPVDVVSFVDKFYTDPENKNAALSVAVSAARAELR